jgi:hypothetical protein
MSKSVMMLGMIIGSTVGEYIPTLFGAGSFSFISIMGGIAGGILGMWLTYRFVND